MTRIDLNVSRLFAIELILKVSESVRHLSGRGAQAGAWRPLALLLSALFILSLCAASTAAQLSLVVVEKNSRRVLLPTNDVTRIPGVRRGAAQPISVIPMSLEVGDVLVGNTGVAAVKVRCYSTEAAISGKFRVRILPSSAPACNLFFEGSAGARLNATASGPTSVVSGAMTLGTRRTRYEIEIPKKGGGLLSRLTRLIPIAKVFEGEARVLTPVFTGAVTEGKKFVSEGIREIEPEDYLRAAEVYAKLDVSQAVKVETVELSAIFLGLAGKPETEVKATADQVVAKARAGSDFCALAREYSDRRASDPCKLGVFSISDLPPDTANVIRNVKVGDITEPLRSADVYQILRVDARKGDTLNDDELKAAYLKLLGLHRGVLERPHDPSQLTALRSAQQELGVPPSDAAIQQPPLKNPNEVTLKPNEKLLHGVTVNNACNVPLTFGLAPNASFARLVSPAQLVVSPGAQGTWQLEYDATGLKPGTYTGEIVINCLNCANTQCVYPPEHIRLVLNVL